MALTVDSPVGEIAATYAAATRVFAGHDIDFCCGGRQSLRDAADAQGLDADAILREIEDEIANPETDETAWVDAPLGDLIDHLLAVYHRPLDQEMPRLEQMARKVLEVHGEKDPERFAELLAVYLRLKAELEQHMVKEEQILFPMIAAGHGEMADGPITVMHLEHDSAAAALRRLRELTDGYTAPPEACATWQALWHGLSDLEDSLHRHIHLENNILFPRALAG